jgi:hypothetical protein
MTTFQCAPSPSGGAIHSRSGSQYARPSIPSRFSAATALGGLDVLLRHRLLRQPRGFEGLPHARKPATMNDLPGTERPDVGIGSVEIDAGEVVQCVPTGENIVVRERRADGHEGAPPDRGIGYASGGKRLSALTGSKPVSGGCRQVERADPMRLLDGFARAGANKEGVRR